MKTLRALIYSLNPYATYSKEDASIFKKTLLCENIRRLKIIGIIGITINFLLLALYFLQDGISGLTTYETYIRIIWNISGLIYIFGVGKPQSPNEVTKRQFLFFYIAVALCPLYSSLIITVLSVDQSSTFIYIINVLLIGSFLYLSFGAMLTIITPSFLILSYAILFLPNSVLSAQGNLANAIASTIFAVIIAQTLLVSKLNQLANMQTIVAQKKELEYLIDLDGLTRIPNRRKLESYFLYHLETPFTLLMIDIDNFKDYNDTYGHLAGDLCLFQVAQSLFHYPIDGLTARYGGEEFIMIIKHQDPHNIKSIIENIRHSIELLQIPHKASSFGIVTISIGYVVYEFDSLHMVDENGPFLDLDSFISKADQALYAAKNNGRNQIIEFK